MAHSVNARVIQTKRGSGSVLVCGSQKKFHFYINPVNLIIETDRPEQQCRPSSDATFCQCSGQGYLGSVVVCGLQKKFKFLHIP